MPPTKQESRFRLSAEGQQEVIDAFRKIQSEAEKANKSQVNFGQTAALKTRDATQAVELFSQQIGIGLPRSVAHFIGSLDGIQTAMAAAFNATIVLAVAAAALKVGEKLGELLLKLRGISDEALKAEKAIEAMQASLFAPKTTLDATKRVAELNTELQDARRSSDAVGRSIFGWQLPRWMQTDQAKFNLDKIAEIGTGAGQAGKLTEAENTLEALRVKAAEDAATAKKALQEEISVLDVSEAQKIRILSLREQEGIAAKLASKDISQAQADELTGLIRTKEALQLKALALKDFVENAKRAAAAIAQLETARAAAMKAGTENEIAILRARNKLVEDDEKAAFDQGLINVDSYFADRRQRLEAETKAEADLLAQQAAELRARMEAEQARPLAAGEQPQSRDASVIGLTVDLAKAESAITQQQLEAAGKRISLENEFRGEIQKTGQAALAAEGQRLTAEGQRFEAERVALAAEIAGLQKLSTESAQQFQGRKDALQAAGEAAITFRQAKADLDVALNGLAAERQAIRDQVEQGLLFEFQGEEKLAAIERDRLPGLQALADQKTAAAEATGIEANKADARQSADDIKGIAVASDTAGHAMANFKNSVDQALTSDLTDFFSHGIEQAHSFGDAVRSMAFSIVASLQQVASQMLATLIISKALGFLGGLFGGGGTLGDAGGIPGIGGGGIEHAAEGGLIRGPGTGTSDSIHTRLSNFEYIVRAAVVKQPGMLNLLEQLNRGELNLPLRSPHEFRDRFAEGGLVEVSGTPGAAGAAGAPGPSGRAQLEIGLDPGLILKTLEASPMFARAIIRTLDRNRKSANNALGHGR